MNKPHRFHLDQSKPRKRFICPECGKKELVLYVDGETDQYLSLETGRCNRLLKCSYHQPPRLFFNENKLFAVRNGPNRALRTANGFSEAEVFSTISLGTFEKSQKSNKTNHFLDWLNQLFATDLTEKMVNRFHIGTSKFWPGATVFWQVDELGNVRTGKIIQFNPTTGHRIKTNCPPICWAHNALRLPNFQLKQCLFGLHQLSFEPFDKIICLVEAEKTATIMSAIVPKPIWMATGGLGNLNVEICKPLKNRRVILYPDAGCFEKWNAKLPSIQKAGVRASISDLLETETTEHDRRNGFDLVDYFTRSDGDLTERQTARYQC